jgi:hypothetical protein
MQGTEALPEDGDGVNRFRAWLMNLLAGRTMRARSTEIIAYVMRKYS